MVPTILAATAMALAAHTALAGEPPQSAPDRAPATQGQAQPQTSPNVKVEEPNPLERLVGKKPTQEVGVPPVAPSPHQVGGR